VLKRILILLVLFLPLSSAFSNSTRLSPVPFANELNNPRGAVLNYGLVAFSPWEGYEITFIGTEGTLSQKYLERSVINGDESSLREGSNVETTLLLPGKAPEKIKNPGSAGGHGGADPLMLDHIFADDDTPDPLKRKSNHFSAAWSAITGFAINDELRLD